MRLSARLEAAGLTPYALAISPGVYPPASPNGNPARIADGRARAPGALALTRSSFIAKQPAWPGCARAQRATGLKYCGDAGPVSPASDVPWTSSSAATIPVDAIAHCRSDFLRNILEPPCRTFERRHGVSCNEPSRTCARCSLRSRPPRLLCEQCCQRRALAERPGGIRLSTASRLPNRPISCSISTPHGDLTAIINARRIPRDHRHPPNGCTAATGCRAGSTVNLRAQVRKWREP